MQGTAEEPIVYDGINYEELVKDVPSLAGVLDILDRLNVRKRIKRDFYMAIRKARTYITADREMFQEEAEDSSWAVMYWKL
jgi:hypothetical protein